MYPGLEIKMDTEGRRRYIPPLRAYKAVRVGLVKQNERELTVARTRRHCPSHKIGETVRKGPSRFRNSTAQIRITDPKQFLEMHLTHSVPADRRLAFSEWATDTMSTCRPTTRWQEIPGEIFMTSVSRPPGSKAHKVGGKDPANVPSRRRP